MALSNGTSGLLSLRLASFLRVAPFPLSPAIALLFHMTLPLFLVGLLAGLLDG
jgi:hypothetical protein